jgi:hypothetical protein
MVGRNCKQFRVDANRYNPEPRRGLAGSYFSKTCPDPYTALNYWRRRFKSQNCYLGNYFVPYNTKSHNFGTTVPYNANGFSVGNACPALYLGPRQKCNVLRYNNNISSGCLAKGNGQ